jgi:hypothetical protein
MALPNFNINPYVQPYMGGIQKETGELMDQRVQDYDIAAEGYDVLGYQTDTLLQNVAPFEADRLYGQELMGKYRNVIGEAANRGDYEFMVRDVKKAARQFGAETSPLLARRKAFDGYKQTVQDQYQKGDIDLDMYNAALNKTVRDNSNVSKEAVQSGSFSGFVPTKKTDLTKYSDDIIKGMESQGLIGELISNPDGTYTIRGGEYRSAKDIEVAVRNALNGSSDVRNYEATLGALGLKDKFEYEKQSAINAVIAKYQFYKDKSQQGYQPEWYHNDNKPVAPVINAPDVGFYNSAITNPYEGLSIKEGVIVPDTHEYFEEREGGNYYKYVNAKGEPITITEVNEAKKVLTMANTDNKAQRQTLADMGITPVQLSSEELKTITAKADERLTKDAEAVFMLNKAETDPMLKEALDNPQEYKEFLEDYSRINKGRWNTTKFKNEVLKAYKEATETGKVLVGSRSWENPNSQIGVRAIKDPADKNEILAVLGAGEQTVVLSTDKNSSGDREDINTVLTRLEKDGSKVTAIKKTGLTTWNPVGGENYSGIRYSLITEKDGKTQTVQIVVPVEDPLLQPSQAVMNKVYTGSRGIVPFRMNLGQDKSIDVTFDVVTAPNTDPKTKKVNPFIGTIQVKNAKGEVVDVVATDKFPDYYKELIDTMISPNYIENTYFRTK